MSDKPPTDASANPGHPNHDAATESRPQKMLTAALWIVLVIVVAGMVVAKSIHPGHPELGVVFPTSPFALTDQDGKPFSSENLRGHVYVCDFIFTTCGMVCPTMTHKLSLVQQQTPPGVQLVSFTVDAAHDTPPVLKEYAAKFGADLSRWHFLTGTPEQMKATVANMKLGFQAADERNPIVHSEKFLLIDGAGSVRGVYESGDEKSMADLVTDATWLAGR